MKPSLLGKVGGEKQTKRGAEEGPERLGRGREVELDPSPIFIV